MKTLLTSIALAAPALAVQGQIGSPGVTPAGYSTNHSTVSLPYEGMATGDFDGDLLQDIAYFHNGLLTVQFAPGMFDASFLTGVAGDAVASLPTNAAEDQNSLLIGGPNGLQLMEWEATPGPGQWVVSSISGVTWPAVTALRTHVGSDGMVVAGLEDDGQTIHAIHTDDLFLSASTVWTSFGTRDVGAAVVDFTLLDWNARDEPEIAVATAGQLDTHKLPFTTNPPYTSTTTPGFDILAIDRIEHIGFARNFLALLKESQTDPNQKYLCVYSIAGLSGTFDVKRVGDIRFMQTADYNGNDRSDIIFSRAEGYDVTILFADDNAVPTYETGEDHWGSQAHPRSTRFTPEGTTAISGSEVSRPAIVDLDNDGDLDICIPNYHDHRMHVLKERGIVDHEAYNPALGPIPVQEEPPVLVNLLGDGEFSFQFTEPTLYPDANHIQVVCWTQNGVSGSFNNDPFFDQLFETNSFSIQGLQTVAATVPSAPTSVNFDEIVYVALRQVHVNSSNEVTKVYSSSIFLFHGAGREAVAGAHWTFVDNYPGAGPSDFRVRRPFSLIDPEIGHVNDGNGHGTGCLPGNTNQPPGMFGGGS